MTNMERLGHVCEVVIYAFVNFTIVAYKIAASMRVFDRLVGAGVVRFVVELSKL